MSSDPNETKGASRTGRSPVRMYLILSLMLLLVLWGARGLGNTVAYAQSTPAATVQPTSAPMLPSTPVCKTALSATPALTEGPYYKAGSPERTSLLETGIPGTPIIVTGYVLTLDCKPLAHAWLDFWQADGKGAYDNQGYKLRGYQYTDEAGRYTLETVFPGEYPGRTQHIHVKVRAGDGPILTTQIFFPGEAGNQRDSIFNSALVVSILDPATGMVATGVPTQSATAAANGEALPVIYTINFVLVVNS